MMSLPLITDFHGQFLINFSKFELLHVEVLIKSLTMVAI